MKSIQDIINQCRKDARLTEKEDLEELFTDAIDDVEGSLYEALKILN